MYSKCIAAVLGQSHIPTHLVFLVPEGTLFKKAQDSVVLNLFRMKFGRIVLQVNTH